MTTGETEPEPDTEITLTWITVHPGVTAYAPLPPGGRYPRDNRGRPRPRHARLRATEPTALRAQAMELALSIVDVGTVPHDAGQPFNTHSRERLRRLTQRPDEVGVFAEGCLDRGYAIEQESSARAALRAALDRHSPHGKR